MRGKSSHAAILMAALVAVCSSAGAEDWPCFRGPNRSGVSLDKGLPLEWNDAKNIAWRTKLPGAGASSPVTFGDRIYLTCYSGYGLSRESPGKYEDLRRHVVCLERDSGKILWDVAFANTVPDDHYGDYTNQHGYASSTAAVDETGVYVFFGSSGARAYRHDGALKWQRSCGTKYFNFGSASSPVLFDDLVIINASIEDRALIALDKQSGQEKWRMGALKGHSYGTPLLIKHTAAPELIFQLGEDYEGGKAKPSGLAALDPHTGQRLWECISINGSLNPSPIAHEGMIFASGDNHRLVAIRSGGRGDVAETHLAWDIKQGTGICTPVFYEGHVYWTNEESGIAYCVNAATGAVVYKERLQPRPGKIYASGVIADGKLYYVSRENGTFVLPAAPRFEVLAHNTIESDDSIFNATPAISRGQLLLRSDKYLYCIGEQR